MAPETPRSLSRAELVERRFEKPLLVAAVLSVPTTLLQVSQTSEP
jgi:hypothetical protein